MKVTLLHDPAGFLDRARDFLLQDEARNNLLLGINGTLIAEPEYYPVRKLWIVEDGDRVVGAALRTPPYGLVLGDVRDDAALALFVDATRGEDLPGVVGLVPAVHAFGSLYFDGEPRVVMRQGVFVLECVNDVPQPAGLARPAEPADRELIVRWWRDFAAEALAASSPATDDVERNVDARLAGVSRGLWLWELDGEPVSMSGWGGQTPNGIRIGPVYTPPELRGHGYATKLVAELSQWLLDGGRRFCFLYTDLTNPTSNAIYERIGYVRIAESCELAFS